MGYFIKTENKTAVASATSWAVGLDTTNSTAEITDGERELYKPFNYVRIHNNSVVPVEVIFNKAEGRQITSTQQAGRYLPPGGILTGDIPFSYIIILNRSAIATVNPNELIVEIWKQ